MIFLLGRKIAFFFWLPKMAENLAVGCSKNVCLPNHFNIILIFYYFLCNFQRDLLCYQQSPFQLSACELFTYYYSFSFLGFLIIFPLFLQDLIPTFEICSCVASLSSIGQRGIWVFGILLSRAWVDCREDLELKE